MDMRKKISLGKRFHYWLERNMAKGTSSMVKLLLFVVLFMSVLVTVLMLVFRVEGEGKDVLALFWDNLRAAMDTTFPASDSGSPGYIILCTLLGLTGIVFTSMLIGIFSTSMQGKLLALQTKNPELLEEGHVVVLGFRPGEYALLEQLMAAADGESRTIAVVEKMERVEMEQAIRTNLKVPRNIRLVAIDANPEVAAELSCCAIDSAATVVIYTREAGRTVKTWLAVSTLLKNAERRPKLVTAVDAEDSDFPDDLLPRQEVSLLHSGSVVARTIAHAATQPGIFDAFLDMIDFDNFEFYFEALPELTGLPFWNAVLSTVNGISVGIYREGRVLLNPPPDTVLLKEDLLAVFEEKPGDIKAVDPGAVTRPEAEALPPLPLIPEVVIFGVNASVATVIRELPDNIRRIRLAGITPADYAEHLSGEERFLPELTPDYRAADSEEALAELVRDAAHVIVLSDRKKEEEAADTEAITTILRLRNLKKRLGLSYTITAEMRCENNRKLISESGVEEIVVASDLSSMLLAQVAEDPRRLGLFNELLDESGCEVYLKPAADFGIVGRRMTVRELRRHVYAFGYIPMGIRTKARAFLVLDDDIDLLPEPGDWLVLLGEE